MSQVIQLENSRDQYKKAIELRDLAEKLSANSEFRKLILEEFMVNEAARYVATSADPAMGPNERADALNIAQSAGHLKRWLSVVVQMGNVAENNMVDLDNAINEARQEEGE